jgi:glyoxylase-like metal-dependent hydrolase (beta-lactamase superfamily II)
MSELTFDRDFDVEPGRVVQETPLLRRILCDNPSPFTFKGTSSFIVGRGTVAIIDPGPNDDAHLAALLAAVRGETVSHILITHTHSDHSALALRLSAATGAPTYGYGPAAPKGLPKDDIRLDAGADPGFAPDVRLAHGDTVSGLGWTVESVFTPGHMSNHMAYALKEEQALFCGDHVMAWATSVIAPPDGHMGQYFASLRLLLERTDDVYYPAHGPSRRDPLPLVRAYLAHRQMREAAILNRLKAGDRNAAAIVTALYADVDPRLHGAAALSVTAHLDHLVEQGKVRRSEGGYEARS